VKVGEEEKIAPPWRYDNSKPQNMCSLVYLKAGTGNLIARIHGEHLYHLGEPVTVQLNLDKVHPFDPQTEKVIR